MTTNIIPDGRIKQWWEEAFQNPPLRGYRMTIQNQFPDIQSVTIPMPKIMQANSNLALEVLDRTEKALLLGNEALFALFPTDVREKAWNLHPIIRVTDVKHTKSINIKDIRSEQIGQLWSVSGRIKKSQKVSSKIHRALWKCERCGTIFMTMNEGLILEEPLVCSKEEGGCGSASNRTRFTLIQEACSFRNFQIVYLEGLAGINQGQPQTIMVFLWDDLVGVFPCNQITINGIVKLISMKKKNTAVWDTYIEAVSIEVEDAKETINISPEDEQHILEIAQSQNPFKILRSSIAPSVFGRDDIKEAIILQQAGGVSQSLPDGSRKRGNIHILLVGDPATAKSTILGIVPSISPIGYYGSGEGTTGAGLTFTMTRDEFDGTWSVEMGLLPMCDGGICCFDELDKTSKEDRARLHTVLESGELPVAKAGIVTTLSADTSLLAGANPKYGRFDLHRSLLDQIDLSPPLISRFDLIFSILDFPNEETDDQMAHHIIDSYQENHESITPLLSADFLRKYFHYVRNKINPELPPNIKNIIIERYKELRQNISGITPRQLEAIIRLSTASAKVHARNAIHINDIKRAFGLFKKHLESVSVDFTTDKIDIDIISAGMSGSQRDRMWCFLDTLKDIQGHEGADKETWHKICVERGYPPDANFDEDVQRLERDGRVFERNGRYKVCQ